MKFLIIGHPKCGSKYMATLMFEFGYEVGHEKYSKDGICCWQNVNVLNISQQWGPQRITDDYYEHVIHYVRNPYHSISSIIVENRQPESYNFRRDLIKHHFNIDLNDHSETGAAILSYVYYNRLAEAQGPTIRIQVENAYEQLSSYLDQKLPKGRLPTNINSNAKRKNPINWTRIDDKLYRLLNDTCKRYGYPSIASSHLNFVP